ncbi:hypothetical protein COO60DRAFT_1644759 [Scenedesmus sp. NREL 46B-D3]|nr:hypothetical protein COO60DRAFT_1644759 [Scenedesmus sp. NREL 46B-D3]
MWTWLRVASQENAKRVLLGGVGWGGKGLIGLQRLLGEHGEIHLSALGMAVSTMVSIAEILKMDGLAVETRLSTCMDLLGGEGGRRPVQKAKMEILLKKSDNFDELIAAEKERQAAEGAAAAHEEEEGEEEEVVGEEAEE